ncbi:MAG: glycosyltransferase family 39 protein, partial [Alphaproteobacteria bacterium]
MAVDRHGDGRGGAFDVVARAPAALVRAIDAHPWLAALTIALVRLATTLPALGRNSFWIDEVWTAVLAVQPLRTILHVGLHDENPPLYNLLAAGWAEVAGVSEVSMRFPSVLASAAAVASLFLVVRRFFGAEAALWSALLFLVNPQEWKWAREARAYGLVQLLSVAEWGLFFELFARPRRRAAVALGLVEAVSVATHYATGLAFAAQAPAAAWAWRRSPRAVRLWVTAQVIAAAACAPLAWALLGIMPVQAYSWRPVPGGHDLLRLASDLAGGRSALLWGLAVAVPVAWFLARGARTWAARSAEGTDSLAGRRPAQDDPPGEGWRFASLASWAVVPLMLAWVVSQRAPMFLARYLLFCALGWVALLGVAVARLPWPPVGRALVAILLAVTASRGFGRLWPGPPWRQAVRVSAEAGAGHSLPKIVVTPIVEDCMTWAWHARRDALEVVFAPVGVFEKATSFRLERLVRRL